MLKQLKHSFEPSYLNQKCHNILLPIRKLILLTYKGREANQVLNFTKSDHCFNYSQPSVSYGFNQPLTENTWGKTNLSVQNMQRFFPAIIL
jgi:hypothetical protein